MAIKRLISCLLIHFPHFTLPSWFHFSPYSSNSLQQQPLAQHCSTAEPLAGSSFPLCPEYRACGRSPALRDPIPAARPQQSSGPKMRSSQLWRRVIPTHSTPIRFHSVTPGARWYWRISFICSRILPEDLARGWQIVFLFYLHLYQLLIKDIVSVMIENIC